MTRETYDAFAPVAAPADDGATAPTPTIETSDTGARTLVGYVVVWNAVTSDIRADGYRHRYREGSVVLAPIVNALWTHDVSRPLASTANGTLRITFDRIGVRVEIDLDGTQDGRDTLARVESRLVTGMSMGGVRNPRDVQPTSDPSVIDITRIVMDDASVLLVPSVAETAVAVVGSDAAKNLALHTKDSARIQSKDKLNRLRLAIAPTGHR